MCIIIYLEERDSMNQQQEKEEYIESIKNFNDRELAELQTYYARKTMDYAKSTNGYLFVMYVLAILSILGGIISLASIL